MRKSRFGRNRYHKKVYGRRKRRRLKWLRRRLITVVSSVHSAPQNSGRSTAHHVPRPIPKKKKYPGRNRHHMTNKKYGGQAVPHNILLMRVEPHNNLHHFFGNLGWEEIGDSIRTGAMRERKFFRDLSDRHVGDALFSIFRKRDPTDCVRVIERISRAKGRI